MKKRIHKIVIHFKDRTTKPSIVLLLAAKTNTCFSTKLTATLFREAEKLAPLNNLSLPSLMCFLQHDLSILPTFTYYLPEGAVFPI